MDKTVSSLQWLLGIPNMKREWAVQGAGSPMELECILNGLAERGLCLFNVVSADNAAFVIAFRDTEEPIR